eukprot:PhM_4_TR15442/c0_g1_i1/m.53017
MSEFNALAFLGVSSSASVTVAAPPSSSCAAGVRVLAPKIKAAEYERQFRSASARGTATGRPTAGSKMPSSVGASTPRPIQNNSNALKAAEPIPRASASPQPGIAVAPTNERVEIYEGPCPSNLAINQQAAREREEARARQRERDREATMQQLALAQRVAAEERQKKLQEREATRTSWDAYMHNVEESRHREARAQRHQKEAEQALIAASRSEAEAEARRLQEKKNVTAEDLRHQLQLEINRKAAKKAQNDEEERQRLFNATLVEAQGRQRDLETERHQRAALRSSWELQQRVRAQRREEEEMHELEVNAVAQRQAAEKAAEEDRRMRAEAQRRANLRRDLQRTVETAHEHRHLEAQRRRDEERRAVAEELEAARRRDAQQRQAEHERQERLRADIARQIEEKVAVSAARRRHADPMVPLVAEPAARILVRCPATGRLLPPEHFNLNAATARNTLKRVQ